MQIGMIGLGRMGAQHGAPAHARRPRLRRLRSLRRRRSRRSRRTAPPAPRRSQEFVEALQAPRTICLMVPAARRRRVDCRRCRRCCRRATSIIDGGNSHYHDDIARARRSPRSRHPLRRHGHQRRRVGHRARLLPDDRRRARRRAAPRSDLPHARPGPGGIAARRAATARASTAEHGYLHCGPAGAGHFVKMVHNGIEYGLMAAYAEGLNILRHANIGSVGPRARRRDDAAAQPRALPVRLRSRRHRRGVASRQRHHLVAARPHGRRRSPPTPASTKFGGTRLGLRRGPLDACRPPTTRACRRTCSPPRCSSASRRAARIDFQNQVLSAMRFGFGGHVEKK